ncbi:MAG: heparinase II/III family protein [Emcibacter sp.]|nr:heparinase II/III family protein [Emcibacter sp.]
MVLFFSKFWLYVRTLSYLKPIQIANRIKRKIFPAKVNVSPAPFVRPLDGVRFYYIRRPKSLLGNNSFLFLNKKEKLLFPTGWNDEKLPKLWLYNLHYFEGLLHDGTSQKIKNNFIAQWIAENPPGYGNGWEPYPISLRISNWIKWSLSGNKLTEDAIYCLSVQVRFLLDTIEYHLLGNHLLANAKALIMAGLFFEGDEAKEWYESGFEILSEQMPEQFLEDGAHFELSTTYHALLTEDIFDIIQMMQIAGKKIPQKWINVAEKALEWLRIMTRPDGLPPLFNDAAYGIAPSLSEMDIYASKIGLKTSLGKIQGMSSLNESGYFRFETECYSLFGDFGPIGPSYIPGHGHCDMGNFELFAHGAPIIVDTGTSTYDVCSRRQYERSTAAHNTVQIGTHEQSEIWGAFRVGRRAKILDRIIKNDQVFVRYLTYKKAVHERFFSFTDKLITIIDEVSSGQLTIASFHLHPDVKMSSEKNIVKINGLVIEFEGANKVVIEDNQYAPEFNKLLPIKVIRVTFLIKLTTKITL